MMFLASTTSEVKNDHAHVITQDIGKKFIEINFCVECMVSQPNRLLQGFTTLSLTNLNKEIEQNRLEDNRWVSRYNRHLIQKALN